MDPTAKVFVRHALNCPDRRKGSEWRRCDCRKSLLLYDGTVRVRTKDGKTKLTNRVVSARTRSWSRAEDKAQEWLDQFNPEKQELKRFRAAKERQAVRIEHAVGLYIKDQITQHGDTGTVAMVRSLLGKVDPETDGVKTDGHLFSWLKKQEPRPEFIADITPTHLTQWRASWKFNDLTAAQRWGMVRSFFLFCESQGWINDSPSRKLKPLKVGKGIRTTIFTDEQYDAIRNAIPGSAPKNVPTETHQNWEHRLEAFLELMRWSGMDIVDAVLWIPASIDAEGVLRYHRQKTKELATVQLPEHVVALLRNVPLERDSVGSSQPFRTKAKLGSDERCWQHRLETLFKRANVTEVQTGHRTKKPHPKMLRHTFAVWNLRHGASIHTVQKMLGHGSVTTTERAYLPWVKELEAATLADARRVLQHAPKRKSGGRVVSIA